MRSSYTNGVLLSVGVLWAATAWAQNPYGSPSLLALPESGPQLQAYSPVSYNASAAPTPDNSYGVTSSRRSAAERRSESIYTASADDQSNGTSPALAPEGPAVSKDGSVYNEALCAGWANDCACCLPECGCRWFGSIGGLVMSRNHANPYWTTYETNNNPNQLLNTKDASAGWNGGGEFAIGHWFGCCCTTGVEFTYFGLGHLQGFASIRDTNDLLSTPIDLGNVFIGGATAASFFDNAREHRIWRDDEIHNLEINLLQRQIVQNSCLNCTWIAGVRYFRFAETLTFGSASGGTEFGDNGGVDEAYLRFRCTNDLIGPQLGVRARYAVSDKFSVYATPKMGIFGSSINTRAQLYRGDGLSSFDIPGYKNDFSMLGQIDLGGTYQINSRLRAYAGYRAIAISQLALGDNQFLPFLADAAGFAEVKSNGDLILHGAMAGLELNF